MQLHNAGKLAEAEHAYQRILAADPRQAEALALLGVLLHQRGQHAEAAGHIERSLALKPRQPTALLNLGSVRRALGNPAKAETHYRAALALKPDFADAWKALGETQLAQGAAAAALESFRRFAGAAPGNLLAPCRAAQAQLAAGATEEAAATLQAVLARDPTFAEAHAVLADVARRRGDAEAALEALWRAIALGRATPGQFTTLGNLYRQQDKPELAEFCFRQVVAQQPRSADALANLGALLHVMGRGGARAVLEAAIALQPDHAEAHGSLGLVRLFEGEWEGWDDYAWRQRSRHARTSRLPWPAWEGQALLPHETLVVWGEQGVGDEIMFASMVGELPGRIVLVGDARLKPLMQRALPRVRFVAVEDAQAELSALKDAHVIAAGSLGRFRRRSDTAFSGQAFLQADAAQRDALAARYRARAAGRKLVGFSWRSGNAETGARRTVSLEAWLPLLRRTDCLFVNLQYGDVAAELAAFAARHGVEILHDPTIDPLRDMDGFAAQVAALDIVISADNSTVHVAGALGVPTLALLAAVPDWRWRRSGGNTPWYAAVRLLRQDLPGQWDAVIGEANAALDGRTAPVSPRRPVAVLLNDTAAWYHWGCTGTSTALREQLERRGYDVRGVPITRLLTLGVTPQDFESADTFAQVNASDPDLVALLRQAKLMLVNGEGSLHGATPTALRILYLCWLAKTRFGAALHIVNHSCYPDAEAAALYAMVYRAADYVAVREPLSVPAVLALGVEPALAFDSLPLYVRDHFSGRPPRTDVAVLAGSVLLGGRDAGLYPQIVQHLRSRGLEVVVLTGANGPPALEEIRFALQVKKACGDAVRLVEARSAADWLATIAGARLLVSGRFHHSIAAAALGTPFVAFGSNTQKVEGLMQALGGEPPVAWTDPAALATALARIDCLLAEGMALPPLDELCRRAEGNFAAL
jgi:tetratricopeptide (TPR) repeat protein/ADP-heptose:LPS heptosyltransferase